MRSIKFIGALALAVFIAVAATTAIATPLPNGTVLVIEQGDGVNAQCANGSCFSMEVSPGNYIWTNFGPGTDGGIVVGKDQASGGQETGPSSANTTDGELSAAWFFFGNYGTFFTSPGGGTQNLFDNAPCSGAACIGKTELKVFHVAWNGNVIPMGSAAGCTLSNCTANQQAGIFVSDWQIDGAAGTWSMTYSQVVPAGSFVNVPFGATLRGFVDLCADAATRCNDNEPCTTDACVPATGACTHTNLADNTACNDNNACTSTPPTADKCTSGVCGGTPKTCTNNACRADTCNPANGVCTRVNINPGGACDDNNDCTSPDVCVTGSCNGTTIANCCIGKVLGTPCSDGNACTLNDGCDGNDNCAPGPDPIDCDDNNACTSEICDTSTGCVYTAITCNDNNICTTDTCDALTGCVYTNNTLTCDDNNACTDNPGDTCSGGSCNPGTTVICPIGTCDPEDGCLLCSDAATRCDDNNICTADTCETATSNCVHTPIANCTTRPPTAPVLVYPSDGQIGVGRNTEFRWKQSTDPDNAPLTYKLYYCTTPDVAGCAPVTVASRSSKGVFYAGGAGLFIIGMTFFGGLTGRKRIVLLLIVLVLFAGGTLISCSKNDDTEVWPVPEGQVNYVAPELSGNTTYYWKVVADNGKTGGTKESAVQSFTTE